MKRIVLAGLTVLSLTASAAFAQQGYYPCQGYGCGMMMGPGMMGGMMGPGMMGGYGMGPGMMGGYGMMGPGMGMMGPGMMGGYTGIPDLTKEQADKIDRIRDDLAKKETPLTQQLFEERQKLQDMYASGADPATLDQAYKKTTDLERQVFNARADAQKRMNAVLTKEQRDRMQRMQRGYDRGYGRGYYGPGRWRDYDDDMMMGPGMWDWH